MWKSLRWWKDPSFSLWVFLCFPNVHHVYTPTLKPLKSLLPSLRSGCRNHNFCRSWRMLTLIFTTKPRFWDSETNPKPPGGRFGTFWSSHAKKQQKTPRINPEDTAPTSILNHPQEGQPPSTGYHWRELAWVTFITWDCDQQKSHFFKIIYLSHETSKVLKFIILVV